VAFTRDDSLQPGVDDRFSPHDGRSRDRRARLVTGLQRLIGPAAVLAVWSLASGFHLVSPRVLPSPGTVLAAAGRLIGSGELQRHLMTSTGRAMLGLVCGTLAGLVLALIAGLSRLGENLLDTNIQMLRAMPILALMPLAIVWLGIGETMKVTLVALGVFFPIYLNTHAAIRGTDSRYLDLAETVKLSRWQLIRHVILPGSLPGFFTGLRFSVAICWLVLVVAEQTNATSGIGYLMSRARGLSQTDVIMVGLAVYALLGLTSDAIVRLVENRGLTWRSVR
jgi:sulfonate transport system permease protein